MGFDVFISYSTKDKPAADAACAAMEAAGVRCWVAPRDIVPGADWGASIIEALDQCRAMVLIFSANANDSLQIRNEVVRAVQRGVPVIPMRIEDIQPVKSLAYYMGSVHWLDALSPPLDVHFKRLAESVKVILRVGETAPLPAAAVAPPLPVAAAAPPPGAAQAPTARSGALLPAIAGSLVTLAVIAAGLVYFQGGWRNPLAPQYDAAGSKQPQLPAETKPVAQNQAAPVVPAPPPAAPAQAQKSLVPDVPVANLLLARFAALTPNIALPVRERVAREYAESRQHKAQAAGFGQNPVLWRASIRDNPQQAEQDALENCQLYRNAPCILVAVNDTVLPVPESGKWAERNMPRLRYAGEFNLDQLPGVSHLRQRPDVAGYAAAAEPKAAAVHPSSQIFVVTGAASQRAAEERVLDICNRNQSRPNGLGPCFLYAVRNQVVLPQRLTKPVTN